MGFFSDIFKSKEEKEKEALLEIFKMIHHVLNSDEEQNKTLPPFFLEMYDPKPVNINPGAYGEFGKCLTNPIPVNGPFGEVTYLSKLLTEDGEKVYFHRLGSKGNIDLYELFTKDHWLDILYLDMYHLHKSNYAPAGFIFQKGVTNIRGISSPCNNFPFGFYEMLVEDSKKYTGFPCFDPDAKFIRKDQEFLDDMKFCRSMYSED